MEKPLVSFIIHNYNFEKYIREAVRGALTQTYSPLEIIISDDCSQDNSVAIIQEEVRKYKGPHKVIVNINEKNIGFGGHINKLMTLVKGEFIVAAGGDDISLPERTEKLIDVWTASKFQNIAIYSNVIMIDAEGNKFGKVSDISPTDEELSLDFQSKGKHFVTGCSLAWSRNLFEVFAPYDSIILREDTVIPFRASLTGTVRYIKDPLVLYRRHGKNYWMFSNEIFNPEELHNFVLFHSRSEIAIYNNKLNDLEVAGQIYPHRIAEFEQLGKNLRVRLQIAKYERELLISGQMKRIRLIYKAYSENLPQKKLIYWILVLFFPSLYIYLINNTSINI
ncbi:MAG: glycosyltransferase [bacterium]|nr:glycosyltransferase [bacterium]